MTKRCEPEVGRSIRATGVTWLHKCPDVRFGAPDKVDYHFVAPDGTGIAMAIEVKETTSTSTFPWTDANITVGQRLTLVNINAAGGIGLLAVNYWRSHDVKVRRKGQLAIYRWPFLDPGSLAGTEQGAFLALISDGQPLRLEWADMIFDPVPGAAPWPLEEALRVSRWKS